MFLQDEQEPTNEAVLMAWDETFTESESAISTKLSPEEEYFSNEKDTSVNCRVTKALLYTSELAAMNEYAPEELEIEAELSFVS